jgi:hypothetical protein
MTPVSVGVASKGVASEGVASKGVASKGVASKGVASKGVAPTADPSDTNASVLPASPPSSDREPTSETRPPSAAETGEDEQPSQLLAHTKKQGASLQAQSVRRGIPCLLPGLLRSITGEHTLSHTTSVFR